MGVKLFEIVTFQHLQMRNKFEPSQRMKIPKFWLHTPTHSSLFSPPELKNTHFVMMKTPLNPKTTECLPIECRWNYFVAANQIRAICPPNAELVAINVAKKGNYVLDYEWKSVNINYEELRIFWGDCDDVIDKFNQIMNKYSSKTLNPICFLVYSSRGYDKPGYLVAHAIAQFDSSILLNTFSSISAIHPPGFLHAKALRYLSRTLKVDFPLSEDEDFPIWYSPLPPPDAGTPPIPYVKVNFPGIQELGATPGQSSDIMLVKRLFAENVLPEYQFFTANYLSEVWSQQKVQSFESKIYRVAFEPEGNNIIIVSTESSFSYILDSNGELWMAPISAKCQLPLICRAVIQKKRGGTTTIILTDIMKCGLFRFEDISIDQRIAYLWHYVVESLSMKTNSQQTVEFIVRPLCLLKDANQLHSWISKINLRCSGITFIPFEGPVIGSIFMPIVGCLIPFQATIHSGDSALLYSDNAGEMVPVAYAKIDSESYGIEGRTVYAYYSPENRYWVIKKFSRDIHRSNAVFVISIMRFFDTDSHPIDILKFLANKFANLEFQ